MYIFNTITKKNRKTIRNIKQPMVVMEHRISKTIPKNRQRPMGTIKQKSSKILKTRRPRKTRKSI